MFPLLRKIHMYIGLLSWSIVLVFGIAGLDAIVCSTLKVTGTTARASTLDFAVPPNLTDSQVVEAVWTKIHLPFSLPSMFYGLHRDNSNNLCFNFWSIDKGGAKVTVLEQQRQLQVEEEGPNFWNYLNELHSTRMTGPSQVDWRTRYWSYYTEFGIWTLIAMALTGIWQWLLSRPGLRWAQITILLACVSFAALYILTR
jgi:hypothetical protein